MPILVVGAGGRVGRELVRLLVADGRPVRALLRPGATVPPWPGAVEIVRGDLADRDSLQAACRDIAAAFIGVRDHPQQVAWESDFIELLEQLAPGRRCVKLSAFAAGLDPPPGYGRIHRQIEQRLARSSLDWAVLRPFMYMQMCLDLAGTVRGPGLLPLPLGDARIAMIDCRDVAAAAAALLTGPGPLAGQIDVLTGPVALDGQAMAGILSELLQRRIRYRPLPPWLVGLAMRASGTGAWDVRMRAELFAMLRAGGEAFTTDAFLQRCGRPPRGFAEFARDHASVFARQAAGGPTAGRSF